MTSHPSTHKAPKFLEISQFGDCKAKLEPGEQINNFPCQYLSPNQNSLQTYQFLNEKL